MANALLALLANLSVASAKGNGLSLVESELDGEVKVGEGLNITCSLPDSVPVGDCYLISPKGDKFESGSAGFDSSGSKCALAIESLEKNQFGTWQCRFLLDDSDEFRDAFVSVTDEVRVKDIRLPGDTVPSSYDVALLPELDGDFRVRGTARIDIAVVGEEVEAITLHAKELKFDKIKVTDEEGKELKIVGVGVDETRDFLIITMKESLKKDAKIQLEIVFNGYLNDELAGFYKSSYTDAATNKTKYLAITQFEATDARRAFPCYDEPALKAKFRIVLGRLASMSSISNMPIEKEGVEVEGTEEGYVWDVYQETVKMSTYLLAFSVSDFTFRKGKDTGNNVEFRIWSRESVQPQTEYAARIGPEVLKFYEEYFDLKFPLPKQDMMAIPDFDAGAMENWGFVTYKESALLYEEGVSDVADKQWVAEVIAHELAHQWFGNLVTMEWWTDLWLNEGFASYVEYIGAGHVEPGLDLDTRTTIIVMHKALEFDSSETTHPISVEVYHPDQIGEIFDTISYDKGASVIKMMVHFIGETAFRAGIKNYLTEHQYGNAKQDDLWQALTEAAREKETLDEKLSVKQIMDTWTLQKGHPVINVTFKDGKLTCSQKLFQYGSQEGEEKESAGAWWAPISYTSIGGDFNKTKNEFWLDPKDGDKAVKFDIGEQASGVIVNVQQTGFYRVNYDEDNWEKIRKALADDFTSIHVINRAQIIDDSLSLSKAGELPYETSFSLLEYLEGETELIPWEAAKDNLGYIESMLERHSSYGDLRSFLKKLYKPIYDKLGFLDKEDDKETDVLLRSKIVLEMCDLDHGDCIEAAKDLFAKWMHDGEEIPYQRRYAVYKAGIKYGGEDEWNFLWEAYAKSNNMNEKEDIRFALGQTREPWLLRKYLDMSIDPSSGIRTQDGDGVAIGVALHPGGQLVAWSWLREKWTEINKYFGGSLMSSAGGIVKACARGMNTKLELKELQEFHDANAGSFGTARQDVERTLEKTRTNIQWMEDNYESIEKWLGQQ